MVDIAILRLEDSLYSPLKKREGDWVELTLVKTSGTVIRDS